jgi:hypothetical protein
VHGYSFAAGIRDCHRHQRGSLIPLSVPLCTCAVPQSAATASSARRVARSTATARRRRPGDRVRGGRPPALRHGRACGSARASRRTARRGGRGPPAPHRCTAWATAAGSPPGSAWPRRAPFLALAAHALHLRRSASPTWHRVHNDLRLAPPRRPARGSARTRRRAGRRGGRGPCAPRRSRPGRARPDRATAVHGYVARLVAAARRVFATSACRGTVVAWRR